MQEQPFQTNPNEFNSPDAQTPPLPDQNANAISWTASEYIAHHKSTKWYVMLGLGALFLAAIIWLLTKDEISAAVVIVGAAFLGVYGARPPRELQYQLSPEALVIGQKSYNLNEFRSFTVDDQQAFANINLMPLKRFGAALTIYFDPADEDAIISILSSRLPMEDHQSDPIDKLMHRIRF